MKKCFFSMLCMLSLVFLTGPAPAEIGLDLSSSGGGVASQDSLKIFNVSATGLAGNYWVELKWDPVHLVFRPVAAASQNDNAAYPHADRLVDAKWVKEQLIDGNNGGKPYVIAHAAWGPADASSYPAGHIPGAIHVNTDEIEYDCFNRRNQWPVDPGNPPCWDRSTTEEEDLAKGLTADDSLPRNHWNLYPDQYLLPAIAYMGITKDTTVVVYGPYVIGAARLLWALMYAGVEDVRLLDAGFQAWLDAGYQGSTGITERNPVPSFGSAVALHPEYLASTEQVRAVANGGLDAIAQIVDVRTIQEYIGASEPYDYINTNGRIKGAIWGKSGRSIMTMEDFENENGRLKPIAEIEMMWLKAGIMPNKHTAFYCGGGWRSALAWFCSYMMGWPSIANYPGWQVWSMGPDAALNPIEDESPDLP